MLKIPSHEKSEGIGCIAQGVAKFNNLFLKNHLFFFLYSVIGCLASLMFKCYIYLGREERKE